MNIKVNTEKRTELVTGTDTFFIGVDIGGTKTAVSIARSDGKIIAETRFATESHYRKVIEEITASIHDLKTSVESGRFDGNRAENSLRREIKAIGISCGGPLDSTRGIIQSPPNLPTWNNIPIISILEEQSGIPCYLENDANADVLAEWYWGSGQGCSNIVFLTFGTGIGAGFIFNGELYRGANGLAGEIGHTRIADSGPFVYGKTGSLESYCSGTGISELYKQNHGINLSAREVCNLAQKGDIQALELIETSGRMLGKSLAILIDLLNPECIIIGSIFTRCENLFRPIIEKVITSETLAGPRRVCSIRPSGLGENLGNMAAIGVAINSYKK